MQLKKKNKLSIANQLAIATAALVGSTGNADSATETTAESNENEWEFVGSALLYNESDRVSAFEAIFTAEKFFDDKARLSYKVVLDTLTGSSANGAIAQEAVQTFTRPSGKGQFTIAAFDTPLDDTFNDTRAQFNVSWTDALEEDSRYTVGTNLSKEYDYTSISVNGEYAKDFDRKNTTLSIGASFSADEVDPEGGRPLALSSMVIDNGQFATRDDFWDAFFDTRIDGDGSVDTAELLLGWTQVVNRRMLMQFNYSYSDVSGYLTDPFKILSVIDSNAVTQDLVYENRPDSRTQHTLFGLAKYHLEDSVLNVSYRYLTDDWEIDSHTFDLKWHLFSGENTFWEPHIRYYQQSAAEFYFPFLLDGQALPEFASADYRVGEMTTMTLGLKYGFTMNGGKRAEIRAEYYLQMPEEDRPTIITAVNNFELYPEVEAFTLQFTYFF